MKSVLSIVNNCNQKFDIQIDNETYQKIYQKSIKYIAKQASLPGFRPGKVPVDLVEKNFSGNIHSETIDRLIKENFEIACDEHKVIPIGNLRVDDINREDGKGLSFSVIFEVKPTLGEIKFKGLEIEAEKIEFKEESIETEYQTIAQNSSKRVPADDNATVENGLLITVDSHIIEDKHDHDGHDHEHGHHHHHGTHHYHDLEVLVGDGKFDSEIEKQLFGLKKGDVKKISKTYPADFQNTELAGKTENYEFYIAKIDKIEKPVLDAEFFAQFKNPDITDEASLKKIIKERMIIDINNQNTQKLANAIKEKMNEANDILIPETMINNYTDYLAKQYYKNVKMNDRTNTFLRRMAIDDIKWQLMAEQIQNSENLKVKEGDEGLQQLEDFMKELSYTEKDIADVKSNKQYLDNLKTDFNYKKLVEFLEQHNTLTITRV